MAKISIEDVEVFKLLRAKNELSKLNNLMCAVFESHYLNGVWDYDNDFDEDNCVYSSDRKYLLKISEYISAYSVKEGTEIIFGVHNKKSNVEMCNLEFLAIPDSVKIIMQDAFSGCNKLKNVSFGNGLKIIDSCAFSECGFRNLILPKGLYSIGACAFVGNEFLESVYLPDSIVSIDEDAFAECENLKTIYIHKNQRERFKSMLSEYINILTDVNCSGWVKKVINKKNTSFEKGYLAEGYDHYEDTSDEDIWDAMTDGMYGDYPDEGYDGDYEFMGY